MKCSICLEANPCEKLSCNHVFHKKCIENWFWQGKEKNTIGGIYDSCPLCRTVQTANNFINRKNNLIKHIEDKYTDTSSQLDCLNNKILELYNKLEDVNLICTDLEKQVEHTVGKWFKWKSKYKNLIKKREEERKEEKYINSCGIVF